MMGSLRKFFRLTFRAQLTYGIGIFLTLILGLFIYIETNNNNNFTRQKALSDASDHSSVLASMVKVWVMNNDYAGLEEALENFSIYGDLDFAAVINMDGKIIAHTDKTLLGSYISDQQRIRFIKEGHWNKKIDVEIIRDKEFIDVMRMIHDDTKHIGFVHIRLDQASREKRIDDRIYRGISFGLFYMVITVLLLYFIVNTFTQQLSSLLQTMKKVHDGHKDVRADESDNNELSQLSHEFNNMLDAITLGEVHLKMVKERLEYAVIGANDGIWDWNIKIGEVYFSPRWKEMLGYDDSELPNKFEAWEERVHPDDIEQVRSDIALCQSTRGLLYSNIHRMRHKDGSWVWILARGQTIFDDEGKAIRMVGFHTDITKQKKLEQELLEQEEMMIAQSRHVAMGEMIGMIAHQWRQPITVISMGANNMLLDIALDRLDKEDFKKEAEQILYQTEHLSKTIDDFRNFFRPNKEKDEVKVIDVLLEAKQIVGKSLEYHNITLSYHSDEINSMYTYSRELLQVFLNIIKNSQEAIKENTNEAGHIDVNVQNNKDTVMITIEDNGGGIEENILNRIFDPYFSTKSKKTGTGLGLYMSKTIVNKHLNGSITAENTTNGLRFVIILPKQFNTEYDNE